jgi:hypothetical protein
MKEGSIIVKIQKGKLPIKSKQGFAFDMYMWCYMSEYTQLALSDFGSLGERFVVVAYYCAAFSYCRSIGKKVKFTEDDVKRWFDNMPQKTAQLILDTMMKSKIGGESLGSLVEKSKDQDAKKK